MTDARVLKAALVLLAVLASGFALGVAADRALWMGAADGERRGPPRDGLRGPPPPERVVEHLAGQLDLTAEQKAAVERVLREERSEAEAELEAADQRREEMHQRARQRVRALLDPAQQQRFDTMPRGPRPPPGGGLPGRGPGRGPPRGPPPHDGPPHDGPPPF